MNVGDRVETQHRFTLQELAAYSALIGAQTTGGDVPEPLIGALFSQLLGMRLPGLGTNYLKQETDYHGTAQAGELLLASVQVTRLRPDQRLVDLDTTCRRADGSLIASGRALVYVGDVS